MKKYMALPLLLAALIFSACSPDISGAPDPTPATDPADVFPGARTDAPATDTDDADDTGARTDSDALQAALADAGAAEGDVEVLVDRTFESEGRTRSIIKFLDGDRFHFYKFVDGRIAEKESHSADNLPEQARDGAISEEEARRIALEDAGVSEADIKDYEVDVDDDDDTGRYRYEIDFEVGDVEYEYDIDLYTGEIIKAEQDR